MQNEIKREIIINASQELIYEHISNPKKVTLWFPNTIEGNYEVGEQPIFGFGEHGKNQIHIVAAKPYNYFSYRWVPGANHFLGDVRKVPNTLVEFKIEELENNTCKLTLIESGFESLPPEIMESSFNQNSGGWNYMLGRLETLLNKN